MTPTASIIASVAETTVVRDDLGRQLLVRQLTALDTLRLFKAAGPILSQNHAWLGVASLAISVTSIDGVPVPTPGNELQIEAMVSRLGDSGLAAVATALESETESDASSLAANAGNLPRHPDLIDCLYLVKCGVPFDVAFSLKADERLAFVVVMGTLEGHAFNWDERKWN